MKTKTPFTAALRFCFAVILVIGFCMHAFPRAGGGGGGGGGHSSGGGSHSSGGGSYNSYHSSGSHSGGGGGGSADALVVGFIILIVVMAAIGSGAAKNSIAGATVVEPGIRSLPFPDGLDKEKVTTAFLAIQHAWQNKDLKPIRKWISDGVYQRYTVQFEMMEQLSQDNYLSNINVTSVRCGDVENDGQYQRVDVAVSFTMDDEFISDKYPVFNESFAGDSATEFWTFIKRTDASGTGDLYNNDNCPNCGAPFEFAMGEICRCGGCGTLANSASFDWVLSEITQRNWYNEFQGLRKGAGYLPVLLNDTYFSRQRMEDIGSNVFMQVMRVLAGGTPKYLPRFATAEAISQIEKYVCGPGVVFNRLYTSAVVSDSVVRANDVINYSVIVNATYQRVQVGKELEFIDEDPVDGGFALVLSRKAAAFKAQGKETVFSYECSCCGAPFTDSTENVCTYCGEAVTDMNRNWVLSDISFPYNFPQNNNNLFSFNAGKEPV